MVPFRAIFEAYGATDIAWNQELQKATGSIDGTTMELTVGSNKAFVNGSYLELDVPPIVKNGRVLVPIRFISEALGYDVEWDGAKREVIIKSPDYYNTFYNDALGVRLRMGQGVGENIAMGYGTALRAVGALYNSKGHRENMLMSEYEYLGVGVAFEMSESGLTGTLYLTQNFCY